MALVQELLSYDFKQDDEVSLNEQDLRFILKNGDAKIYVYLNGYLKITQGDSRSIYFASDENFNDCIDCIYQALASYRDFVADINIH